MTVRIPMTLASLGRSRFASSAAVEVLGTLRAHTSPDAPHVARWRNRAIRRSQDDDLRLLTAIADVRAQYVPDFLTPPPSRPVCEMVDVAEAIAGTDPADIDYHLDIAFRGRPIRPEVAVLFGGPEGMERRRLVMPERVRSALRDGPVALAAQLAAAMLRYFDAAIAAEWPRVRDVLRSDMAYRGLRIAEEGEIALLDDLDPQLSWTDGAVELHRPFDLTIDWANDGLLLVPTTTRTHGVILNAEEPAPPMLIYPARATASLWAEGRDETGAEMVDLIGHTRAALLEHLVEPSTTGELSRRLGLSASTVSYHLGILRRAGLVRRARRGPRVTYEQSEHIYGLLGSH